MSRSKTTSLQDGDCLRPCHSPQQVQRLPFPQNPPNPTASPSRSLPLSEIDGIAVDSKQFPKNNDCNKQDDSIGDLDGSSAGRAHQTKAQPAPGKIVQKPHQQECDRSNQIRTRCWPIFHETSTPSHKGRKCGEEQRETDDCETTCGYY